MKTKTECHHCGIEIEFTMEDIKKGRFCSVGDTFIQTKTEIKGKKKRYPTVTFRVLEDREYDCLECPLCKKKSFFNTGVIPTITSIEEDGFYLERYDNLKCEEISRENSEWYKLDYSGM